MRGTLHGAAMDVGLRFSPFQDTFRNLGATLMADERALDQDPLLPAALVQAAGQVDVLLLHLALPAPLTLSLILAIKSGGVCLPIWATPYRAWWLGQQMIKPSIKSACGCKVAGSLAAVLGPDERL